jgi:hypothetical protein
MGVNYAEIPQALQVVIQNTDIIQPPYDTHVHCALWQVPKILLL